jgi:hypothetical protein
LFFFWFLVAGNADKSKTHVDNVVMVFHGVGTADTIIS